MYWLNRRHHVIEIIYIFFMPLPFKTRNVIDTVRSRHRYDFADPANPGWGIRACNRSLPVDLPQPNVKHFRKMAGMRTSYSRRRGCWLSSLNGV